MATTGLFSAWAQMTLASRLAAPGPARRRDRLGGPGTSAAAKEENLVGILEDLQRQGVKNIEMEASCLFSLAGLAGWRAGAVCAVYANRHHDVFIKQERKAEAEAQCIDTGLEAFHVIARLEVSLEQRPGDAADALYDLSRRPRAPAARA